MTCSYPREPRTSDNSTKNILSTWLSARKAWQAAHNSFQCIHTGGWEDIFMELEMTTVTLDNISSL